MGRKKRRYRYNRGVKWPSSHHYRYKMPKKLRLIRIIIIAIVLMFLFLKLNTINPKKKAISSGNYTPLQENILALEIPVDISKRIFEEARNNKKDVAALFATYMVQKEKGKNDELILSNISRYKPGIFASKKTKAMYKEAIACYKQFVLDLEMFPISQEYEYVFENSWHSERTYGGVRKHYGTDIMDPQDERGAIPIMSMGQGVVENIGWNDMGGYRVGVRTKNGAYLYYAHLEEYAPKLKKGMVLEAGDLIGYMGDSGYGKEGTTGEFPVHLHIGIAVKAFGSKETWVNPYYMLKYLEEKDMDILKSRGFF